MITLHNKQKEVINTRKRFKVLNMGRRLGKTTVLCYEALIVLLQKENSLVSYYAPTFSDARDIAWDMFREILGSAIISENSQLLEIKVKNMKNGISTLRLAGWEAVKNRDKGRGVENDLVILDEVAFYPDYLEKFEKVIRPTILTSKGSIIWASTPNGFNHFYDLCSFAQYNDDYLYVHGTSYDNPHNDPLELDKIRNSTDSDRFSQEYLADFKKKAGLVYKDFSRERHVYNDGQKNIVPKEKVIGIDFGYRNPTAIPFVSIDNSDNYYVTGEFYESGKFIEEIIEFLKPQQINKVFPDPENLENIEKLRKEGFPIRDVYKGKGSVQTGISLIQDLFKTNRLFIHSSCKNLIYELESYSYKDQDNKETKDENPIKENDHLLDALSYVIRSYESNKQSYQKPTQHIPNFYRYGGVKKY